MRKFLIACLAVFIFTIMPLSAFAKSAVIKLNTSELAAGVISVDAEGLGSKNVKIRITKGTQTYTYDVNDDHNRFPLQLGNGAYTVMLLEQVSGTKYKAIENKKLDVKLTSANDVYLQSIQMIYWDENMDVIKKAAELTKGIKSDKDKVAAIYDYIIQHVKYDQEKATKVKAGYIPSIEDTYDDLKGICYDYASIFAAMTRSIGIPTKLVMGQKNDIKEYHAWNEVYLSETKEWVIVDTTYDAAFVKTKKNQPMIKDVKHYKAEKTY